MFFKGFANQVSAKALAVGAAALAGGVFAPAYADFDDALKAYAGRIGQAQTDVDVQRALDLWEKDAIAGDVLSRQALGDFYSHAPLYLSSMADLEKDVPHPRDTGRSRDMIKALAWYTMAATHDFDHYSQTPDFRQINARARAQMRMRALTAQMTTEQVEQAQDLVVSVLSSETDFDLKLLGDMYRSGHGLPKENVEALKYYRLAVSRARNANPAAAEEAGRLVNFMTKDEIKLADQLAREWEPPLHAAFTKRSPIAVDIEQQADLLQRRQQAIAVMDIEREFGSENDHIVQQALSALGLYFGAIDGIVGDATEEAIMQFQYSLVEDDDTLTEAQKRETVTGILAPMQKIQLIRRAALKKHPRSQYYFGIIQAEGIGVPVDGKKAERWLKSAANYGDPLAHFALGKYYRQGVYGETVLEPSRSQAQFHFGQAANLGMDQAQDELDDFYKFRNDR